MVHLRASGNLYERLSSKTSAEDVSSVAWPNIEKEILTLMCWTESHQAT